MMSAMQLWSGLPRTFWGEAIMTANYLRNRLPIKRVSNGGTPCEAWFGRKLSLTHLKVYVCLMHAFIPSETRTKMDKVSFQGVFVDYRSSHQHRIYNQFKKTINWHSSLKFFEDWPGGPILNTPTESGLWEMEAGDSDYEADILEDITPSGATP